MEALIKKVEAHKDAEDIPTTSKNINTGKPEQTRTAKQKTKSKHNKNPTIKAKKGKK